MAFKTTKAAKGSSFEDYLLEKPQDINDELLDFYEANPGELDLLANREVIQRGILRYFLWFSLILIGGSRAAVYYFGDDMSGFISEVLLEIVFEAGNAILGGVLAAFLIERLQKKQYEQNVRYRRQIKSMLAARQGRPKN